VEDDHLLIGLELVPRRVDVKIIGLRKAGEHLHVIRRWRVRLGPRRDRALLERERFVGDDELRIEQLLFADPVAGRACALGRVEREQTRLDLFDGEAADRTGELFGENDAVGGDARAFHSAAACAFIFAPRHHTIRQIDIGQPFGEL